MNSNSVRSDPNNSNGNGNGKIFNLKPATDPDTLAILDARNSALHDQRLHPSTRAYFCEVLDKALHPRFFDRKGVVTISDTKLAFQFGVTPRTIYDWKKKIESFGYWWLSKKFVTNMWPRTTYHITCLDKPTEDRRTDSDGTYGGEKLRPAPNSGLGARRPGQPGLPLPGSRKGAPGSKNADLRPISAESRDRLRVRAEMHFGSEPKCTSGESRNALRVRAEMDCGSEPKCTSGESRSQLPARAEADCRLIETQKEVEQPLKIEGKAAPPDLAFDKWVKSLDRYLPSGLDKLEAEFTGKLKAAKSANAKAEFRRRLEAVQEKRYGPKVQDDPPPPKAAVKIPEPEPLSEAELLESAKNALSFGLTLTQSQKAALESAGIKPTK